MKFFLPFVILFLSLSSCVKHVGIHNKDNSSLFTSPFETKTGGSISNHIIFGKGSIELTNIAKLRCKKINTKHKVENFRRTFLGTIITDQMRTYEYNCQEDESDNTN